MLLSLSCQLLSQIYTFLLDSLIQKEVTMLSFVSFLGERTVGTYKQEGRDKNNDYLPKAWKQDFYDSINNLIIITLT